MKKSNHEVKKLYIEYINNSFDLDALELPETATAKERAKKFVSLVHNRQSKNTIENIQDHLQGLGEYIELEYTNYDILERAKKYGLYDNILNNSRFSKMHNKELANEHVENQICGDYWRVIANYIYQLSQ